MQFDILTWKRMKGLAEENGLDCRRVDWHHPTGQRWIILRRRAG